ncbi:MAG: hypothetical protein Q9225_003365 [Loekoesia sp. 1 TL-2023]
MDRFFGTPPVLLYVIDFLDVPSLLNFRSVNKSVNGLISCYQSSIAKHVARNLCPKENVEELSDYHPATLKDLTHFVRLSLARDLAIKAVASDQVPRIDWPAMKGVPPDDELGVEVRQRVQNGLIIISMLSSIHKRVVVQSSKTNTKGQTRIKAMCSQEATEKELLRRYQEYLDPLTAADIVDLNIALWCIQGKTSFDHQAKGGSRDLWVEVMADREIEAIHWLTYHLARNGLDLIDSLWSENQTIAGKAKAKIQADIKTKSRKVINMESSTFRRLLNRRLRECAQESERATHPPYISRTGEEALIYCESTFACRIGPFYKGLPPDMIALLRQDAAFASATRIQCNLGGRGKKGAWRKERARERTERHGPSLGVGDFYHYP